MELETKSVPPVVRGWWDYYAHLGVLAWLVAYFAGLLTWLIRALVTGGTPERIMTTLVIPLLLFILGTVGTVFWVIIQEGKRHSPLD